MKTASFTLLVLLLCLTAHARASDCSKAQAYLDLAENARSDVDAYAQEDTDTSKDLGNTSRQVGQHFLDQAEQYFSGDECGEVTYLRYLAYRWDFGQGADGGDLAGMEPSLLSAEVRIGHGALHDWQEEGLDRRYPGVFDFAVQQFGLVQGFAAASGVNPTTGALPRNRSKHSCAQPNRDAGVTNGVQPDFPESAKGLGLGPDVTVLVLVTIGSSGNILDTSIYKSSDNMALDQAALRAARESSYQSKLVNCQPKDGTFMFRADFLSD